MKVSADIHVENYETEFELERTNLVGKEYFVLRLGQDARVYLSPEQKTQLEKLFQSQK